MYTFDRLHEAARKAFRHAFERGYAEGLRSLVKDKKPTRADVTLPFPIDVPRHAIVRGDWNEWVVHFELAGKEAALSARRMRTAKLDDLDSHPDELRAIREGVCRWYVVEPF